MGDDILFVDVKTQHNDQNQTLPPPDQPTEVPTTKYCLFLHWEYHQHDIPRHSLHSQQNLLWLTLFNKAGYQANHNYLRTQAQKTS